MKNIKYILTITCMALLVACYEDKGSYDYSPVNEIIIDTTGAPAAYAVPLTGQLVIDPVIAFSGEEIDPADLSYEWYFYPVAYVAVDWYPVSREKKLELTPIIYDAGDYKAVLYVTDTKRKLTSHMTFDVTLVSTISHGMLVFHVNGGVADFDYIATPSTVRDLEGNFRVRDVFQTTNGRPLRGNPLTIRQTAVDGRAVNHVYVSTDEELLSLYGRNFILEHDADEMLVPPLPPRAHFEYIDGQNASSQVFFISDGILRYIVYGAQYYTDYSIPTPISTSVRLAPFSLRPTISYTVYPTFYDVDGRRFLYISNASAPYASFTSFPAQVSPLFDVNDIGKDLVYLSSGYASHDLAVFTGGPGDYWLYELDFTKATSLNAATDVTYGKHDMSALPGIAEAVGFDAGNKGYFFLYATKRDIYACDYNGLNPTIEARTAPVTATRINDDFPPGEEITGIKIYKYGGNIYSQGGGSTSDPSYIYYGALNGALFYVSTWDGAQGHLYEFSINPVDGRLESKTPLNRFDDFGRIVDLTVKIQYREAY